MQTHGVWLRQVRIQKPEARSEIGGAGDLGYIGPTLKSFFVDYTFVIPCTQTLFPGMTPTALPP